MSGAITSTWNSGRPKIWASPCLMGSGACVDVHTRSTPVRGSCSAATPRPSIGLPQLRSMTSRSERTRAARRNAPSGSPTCCGKRAARLPGTSAWTSGAAGAIACSSVTTAASGSYSTEIRSAASSAM